MGRLPSTGRAYLAATSPMWLSPHATGLSLHAAGEVLVNHSNLFYSIIQTTPAVGLVAYKPEAFLRQEEWPGIRPLLLTGTGLSSHFGWIKLRRLPLSDIAAEALAAIQEIF